jgi:hypothetical protein
MIAQKPLNVYLFNCDAVLSNQALRFFALSTQAAPEKPLFF